MPKLTLIFSWYVLSVAYGEFIGIITKLLIILLPQHTTLILISSLIALLPFAVVYLFSLEWLPCEFMIFNWRRYGVSSIAVGLLAYLLGLFLVV